MNDNENIPGYFDEPQEMTLDEAIDLFSQDDWGEFACWLESENIKLTFDSDEEMMGKWKSGSFKTVDDNLLSKFCGNLLSDYKDYPQYGTSLGYLLPDIFDNGIIAEITADNNPATIDIYVHYDHNDVAIEDILLFIVTAMPDDRLNVQYHEDSPGDAGINIQVYKQ